MPVAGIRRKSYICREESVAFHHKKELKIYLYKNDEQFGPYSLEQVQAFVDTKSFRPTDSVWFDGCEDWTTLSRVPGIQFTTENLRQHLVPPFESYTGEDPYVFVSYAHADGEIVFREILKLHEAGYRIWFDEGIEPGNDWPQHIAQAVVNCSLFLIFTSPRSVASENCRNEVNLALNRKKKFLSIYLEETELPLGLELRMGDLQAVLKYKMPELSYRKKVFASLEKLLGTEGRDLPQGEDPVAKLMEQKSQADRLAMPSQRKQSEASRRVKKTIEEKSFDNRQTSQSLEAERKKPSSVLWITAGVSILALLGLLAFVLHDGNPTEEIANVPAKPNPEGKPKKKARARPAAEKSSSANQSLHPLFRKRASQKNESSGRGLAVQRGLAWLKKRQSPSGEWKSQQDTQAMTALALMCLLADSPSLDSGNHAKNMSKALRFLTSIPGKATQLNQPKSYSHPIRTQALCEAYLMSKDPALEKFVTPAVRSIIDGQNESGGWAYGYGKGRKAHTDLSVTSWHVQTLHLASLTGLPFPEIDRALKKATDYVSKCQAAKGTFAYKIGTGGKPSLTGAGAYCLMLTEKNLKKQALDSMNLLVANLPRSWNEVDPYAHYYNCHAFAYTDSLQGEVKGHTLWKKRSTQLILENQLPDGSWPVAVHFHGDSTLFRNTLFLLSLQSDYRYAY